VDVPCGDEKTLSDKMAVDPLVFTWCFTFSSHYSFWTLFCLFEGLIFLFDIKYIDYTEETPDNQHGSGLDSLHRKGVGTGMQPVS